MSVLVATLSAVVLAATVLAVRAARGASRWRLEPYDVGAISARVRDLGSRPSTALGPPGGEAPALGGTGAGKPSRRWRRSLGLGETTAAAGMPLGAGAIHRYLVVDDHVYTGISQLAGKQFGRIADLSAHVQTFHHDPWDGLTAKGLDKVKGHIGEAHAAEHFDEAGVGVEWPAAGNQKGWDLLLDGHEVNVKTVSSMSSVTAHFKKYPDVPVVVPSDMGGAPGDAIHFDPAGPVDHVIAALASGDNHVVIVDHALSVADVGAQAEAATDFLLGTADLSDIANLGIPVLTIALSGWREFGLLRTQRTTFATAAGHVAIDAVGVGGGGLAGAKGGAVIGSAAGPAGAVIGGVVGGIGGAVAGKFAGNAFRLRHYNDAVEHLRVEEASFREQSYEVIKRGERLMARARSDAQAALRVTARYHASSVDQLAREAQRQRVAVELVDRDEAVGLIDEALATLQTYAEEARRVDGLSAPRRWWLRVGSGEAAAAALRYEAAAADLARIKDAIIAEGAPPDPEAPDDRSFFQRAKDFILAATSRPRDGTVDRGVLFGRLGALGLCQDQVVRSLVEGERQRVRWEADLRREIEGAQKALVDERVQAQRAVLTDVAQARNVVRTELAPLVRTLTEATQRVNTEAAKAGLA